MKDIDLILLLGSLLLLVAVLKIIAIYLQEKRRVFDVPQKFIPYYNPVEYKRAQFYRQEKNRVEVFFLILSTVSVLTFLHSKAYIYLDVFISKFLFIPQIRGAIYLLVIIFYFLLIKLTKDFYNKSILLTKTGYEGNSERKEIIFLFKALVIGAVFFTFLIVLFSYLFYFSQYYFWLLAIILIFTFKKLFFLLFPDLYFRLFVKNSNETNKNELNNAISISDSTLDKIIKSSIINHCQRLRMPVEKVFMFTPSHSRKQPRAFAYGSRIYIDERICNKLERGELLAILTHEIWHTKNLSLYSVIISPLIKLLFFLLCSWLGFSLYFSKVIGLEENVPHINLFILFLFWTVFVFFKNIYDNSRNHYKELNADAYAKYNVSPIAIRTALCKIVGADLVELGYSQLYYLLNSSHPSLTKRLYYIDYSSEPHRSNKPNKSFEKRFLKKINKELKKSSKETPNRKY